MYLRTSQEVHSECTTIPSVTGQIVVGSMSSEPLVDKDCTTFKSSSPTTHRRVPPQLTSPRSACVTVGSLAQGNETTLNARNLTCAPDTLTMSSSPISAQVSTSNVKVCKPFWNTVSRTWSRRLLSPTETGFAGSALTSCNGSSVNTGHGSWFSIKETSPLKMNSQVTSFPSYMFSPARSTGSASTRGKSKDNQKENKRTKTKKKEKGPQKCLTIRIYPSTRDAKTIRTWFSHSRKTYNLALAALKRGAFKPSDEYRLRWRFVTDKQLGRRLSYLKSTPSKIRAGAVAELCAAYKANFTVFKKKPEHRFSLKFKTRKDEQSLSLQKDSFVKPGSKDKCKLFFPQSIQDAIRTSPILPPEFWTSIPSDCRLTMNKAGEMYIQVPVPAPNLALPSESPERIISLDPGVRTFLTGYSPATQERGPKIVEVGSGDMSRIMRLCYHMDSLISKKDKAKNCTSRRKIQRRIDKLRLKIKRLRTDCHHRTAHYLTTNYDSVLLPTFETSQMVCRKGRKIRSKTVREMQSWSHYAFRQRLITKAAERGTHLIEVTEEYTSKTCCACGTIKWNLGGSKSFRCSSKACGLQIDRDWNGAINILVKYITETFLKALNRTATFIGSGPCKLSLPTGFPS